jgi:sialic acid synthase SpsE
MKRIFRIGDKEICDESGSYVIAEVGHNHQGDVDKCKQIFKAAAEAGADAVKLQKRDNRALFTRAMYDSRYDSENAYAPTYGAHREKLEFGPEQYLELKRYAEGLGLMFFSTAFDAPSADLLNSLNMPAYKIASGDLANISLLETVASFGKPMIISTGGATMADVRRAHDAIVPINANLCIMQCTSGYPPAHEELNLKVIDTFRREFPGVVIGFSSHDSGIVMPVVGYMLGARVFEKHFTPQTRGARPGARPRRARGRREAALRVGGGAPQQDGQAHRRRAQSQGRPQAGRIRPGVPDPDAGPHHAGGAAAVPDAGDRRQGPDPGHARGRAGDAGIRAVRTWRECRRCSTWRAESSSSPAASAGSGASSRQRS